MKTNRSRLVLIALYLLCLVNPALAIEPAFCIVTCSETLVLPVMMLLSAIGGAYVVLSKVCKNRSLRLWKKIILVCAIITWSAIISEVLAAVVTIIFGAIAVGRGCLMLKYAYINRKASDRIGNVHPLRLTLAGSLLLVVAVNTVWVGIAFVRFDHYSERLRDFREKELINFIVHQMAYAKSNKAPNGNGCFDEITKIAGKEHDNISVSTDPRENLSIFVNYVDVKVEYARDNTSFVVYRLPSARDLPLYPYNYLVSAPSYRADETGNIRMIYVHNRRELCPSNAPVVRTISEQDIDAEIIRLKAKAEKQNEI